MSRGEWEDITTRYQAELAMSTDDLRRKRERDKQSKQ